MTFKIWSILEEGEVKKGGPNVLLVGEKEFVKILEEVAGVGFVGNLFKALLGIHKNGLTTSCVQ